MPNAALCLVQSTHKHARKHTHERAHTRRAHEGTHAQTSSHAHTTYAITHFIQTVNKPRLRVIYMGITHSFREINQIRKKIRQKTEDVSQKLPVLTLATEKLS